VCVCVCVCVSSSFQIPLNCGIPVKRRPGSVLGICVLGRSQLTGSYLHFGGVFLLLNRIVSSLLFQETTVE
jgi:hypothetical protein